MKKGYTELIGIYNLSGNMEGCGYFKKPLQVVGR